MVAFGKDASTPDLKDFSDRHFQEVDSNNNSVLEMDELSKALYDDSYSMESRKLALGVAVAVNEISGYSNDRTGPENGVSKLDIALFDQSMNKRLDEVIRLHPYLEWIDKDLPEKFGKWDQDNDGFLTMSELYDAAKDPRLSQKDLDGIALLKTNYQRVQAVSKDELSLWDNNGISWKDISKASAKDRASFSDQEMLTFLRVNTALERAERYFAQGYFDKKPGES